MRRYAFAFSVVALTPALAHAFDWGAWLTPWKTRADVALDRAREARERGHRDLASTLLREAEALGAPQAPLLHERGFLAKDRGQNAEAADAFGASADIDPTTSARVDQAATLVILGRWPEAVEALAIALEERGASLRADDILVDPRFAALVGFTPFQELVRAARDQQAGPIGRLLRKLERVEDSMRTAHEILTVLWRWMGILARFFELLGTSVVGLLMLGVFFGVAITQLGLLRPPWPLFVGMVAASVAWHLLARLATADESGGYRTIAIALGLVVVPYGAVMLIRRLVHERRAFDPLDDAHLARTSALALELGRAGQELERATGERHEHLRLEMNRAAAALRRRLVGHDESVR